MKTDFSAIDNNNTDFSANDHGARPDGQTLCTKAIQKTIDLAAAEGGGKVVFKPGVYLSGSLFLKSGVHLRVDEGVEIRGIQDEAAYQEIWGRMAGIEMRWPSALINVNEQNNVRISGKGLINGQGELWWEKFWGKDEHGGMLKDYEAQGLRWAVDYDCKRPRLIQILRSSDVVIQGLRLKRSPLWTVHICYSKDVLVDGIVIRENMGPSSDGIDIDSSSEILVQNCDIDCNDDAICLKAGRDADGLRVNRPTENVVIRDCVTHTGHGMVTIGSETSGGVRNIEAHHLRALGTWIGVSFKSARTRGGIIENVSIHDIEMVDVPRPFRFAMNWLPSYSYPTIPRDWKGPKPEHWDVLLKPVIPPERGIPEFRHIRFSNITVKSRNCGARLSAPSSSVTMHTADPLTPKAFDAEGYPEKPLRDFHWENVTIDTNGAGGIRNARDWTMKNVVVSTPDGHPVERENCDNVQMPEFRKTG